MKQYLYIFNYPPEQEQLCHLEFKYLFKETFKSKYYFSDVKIDVNTSVFMKARIDIYAVSNDIQELVKILKDKELHFFDFKVIYIKNELNHVDYQESLQWCRDVAEPIDGTVDLIHPKHTIAVTKLDENWVVGYYHHGVPSWKKHDDKPQTFSNSLDIRLARTLVNIASLGNPSTSIVDPCCGVGTVVLEGLGLGLNIVGFDISRTITHQARLNLEYYGYNKNLINKMSIHDLNHHYEVGIMDIPYNLYTPITYEEQCDLIHSARRICDQLIIVTYDDMRKEIAKAGFVIKDECILKKTNYCHFERKIYVCR